MENFIEVLNNGYVILGLILVNIILILLYISNNVKLKKINKKYTDFMKKIGNGKNIEDDLRVYINRV